MGIEHFSNGVSHDLSKRVQRNERGAAAATCLLLVASNLMREPGQLARNAHHAQIEHMICPLAGDADQLTQSHLQILSQPFRNDEGERCAQGRVARKVRKVKAKRH